MTTELVQYETARTALANAISVDEVKDIHNKAEAMRLYGKMARDTELEANAAELRLRAERKLGILLAEEVAAGHLSPGRPEKNGRDDRPFSRVLLEGIGITKDLSSRAQKVAGIAERAFEACVARVRQRIHDGARVSMDIASGDKGERRATRERVLGGIQCALPEQKFGVIVADPAWSFTPYSRETGMDRAADNHYPTQNLSEIMQLDVPKIAADDCALFLWATAPMLPQALAVMGAWGFDYKSQQVWVKTRGRDDEAGAMGEVAIGTGYWWRNCHEVLLLGTKGKIPAPAMGEQFTSVIHANVGKHSQKPEVFLEMIEAYFPSLPKIELNRRGPARAGWTAWGNESAAAPAQAQAPPLPPHDPETGEILPEAAA